MINKFLLGILISLFSTVLCASNIIAANDYKQDITLIKGLASNAPHILQVKHVNEHGIAYIKFDEFEVSGSGLKLVNVASESGKSRAKVIVIEADDIVLNASIELLGPADVVFISTSSDGSVNCNECSLDKMYRVSLLAARGEPAFSKSMQTLGKLSSQDSGSVNINGLAALGAIVVDVMGSVVSLSGEITSNQNVTVDPVGGYSLDINGPHVLGSGSFNLLIGDFDWNYEGQEIIKAYESRDFVNVDADIKAAAVKLSSSKYLNIKSDITTSNDVLSSIQYKGKTHIADGSIIIQSFGGQRPLPFTGDCSWLCFDPVMLRLVGAGLKMNGSLTSESRVELHAVESIQLGALASTSIDAASTKVIAGYYFHNQGIIDSAEIEIAAANIVNNGEIKGISRVDAWASHNFVNEFGGGITGGLLNLQAGKQFRNGSLYPYKTGGLALFNDVKPAAFSHIGMGAAKMGTIFAAPIPISSASKTKADDTTAGIWGESLVIKANKVANINAYWENAEIGQVSLTFNKNLINQVTMSAEDKLVIVTRDGVVNSSAVIRMNSDEGFIHIKGGTVSNERYKIVNQLTRQNELSGNTTVQGVGTQSVSLSPPGIITSLGYLNVDAPSQFINNMAYIEVYGSASLNTPIIREIGLSHKTLTKTTIVTALVDFCGRRPEGGGFSAVTAYFKWRSCMVDYNPGRTGNYYTVPTNEIDSLFSVQGNAYGEESALKISNEAPLLKLIDTDQVIRAAVVNDGTVSAASLQNKPCPAGSGWLGCTPLFGHNRYSPDKKVTIDTSQAGDTGEVIVTVAQLVTTYDFVMDSHIYKDAFIKKYSLIDEVLKVFDALFAKVAAVIQSAMDYTGWWD